MKEAGGVVAGIALLLLVYALTMSTTVSTGIGEVHNIGLMERRQSLLMVAIAFLVIGIGVAAAGIMMARDDVPEVLGSSLRKCHECAENIRAEAKRCKHCAAVVEPLLQECDFCGIVVTRPIEPCSAFEKAELEQSLDRIKSQKCLEALASARIIGVTASTESGRQT